jgi:hypothetical protein
VQAGTHRHPRPAPALRAISQLIVEGEHSSAGRGPHARARFAQARQRHALLRLKLAVGRFWPAPVHLTQSGALHLRFEAASPQAHYVLLVVIANHLREAVDEGRISAVVLQQASDHLKMLVEHGPAKRTQ